MPPIDEEDAMLAIDSQSAAEARAAWGRIAEHLVSESEWRMARDVDVLDWYDTSEPIGDNSRGVPHIRVSAAFQRMVEAVDKAGHPAGYLQGGDVFEATSTMARLGQEALDALLARVDGVDLSEQDIASEERSEDRCKVRLDIGVFRIGEALVREPESSDALESDSQLIEHPTGRARSYSELVCRRALERIMIGWDLDWHDEGKEHGTHDLNLSWPGSRLPPTRVEITEVVSETEKQWSKAGSRIVKNSSGLRHQWHVEMVLHDALSGAWRDDELNRMERSKDIDDRLLERLLWAESQMSTAKGARNIAERGMGIANRRWKQSLRNDLGVSIYWVDARSSQRGGLWVSYPRITWEAHTVYVHDTINKDIKRKAQKNQPGRLKGDKWLVLYIGEAYSTLYQVDMCLTTTSYLPILLEKVNLQHYQEVWLVWEESDIFGPSISPQRPLGVLQITPEGPRYSLAVHTATSPPFDHWLKPRTEE